MQKITATINDSKIKMTLVLAREIHSRTSAAQLVVYLTDNIERFYKKYLADNAKRFSCKILGHATEQIRLVPQTVRKAIDTDEGTQYFINRYRDADYQMSSQAVKLEDMSLSGYRFGASAKLLFNFEINTRAERIESFVSGEDAEDILFEYQIVGGNNKVKEFVSSSDENKFYAKDSQLIGKYLQPETGIVVYSNPKNMTSQPSFLLYGLVEQGTCLVGDLPKDLTEFYANQLGLGMTYAKYASYKELKRVVSSLRTNISKHIQYDHLGYSVYQDNFTALLFEALETTDDAAYQVFRSRFTDSVRTLDTMFSIKPSRFVPKNGEKFAGNRLMEFRSDFDNILMAVGVDKLYGLLNIPTSNLGSRINDGRLIPYIYTYNLYRELGVKASGKFQHCMYFDLSDFFNKVTYKLVEDAVMYFCNEEQRDGCQRALSLIRKAMTANGCLDKLTIDSNYEHALSTIVMSYLLRNAVDCYSFVDDILLFGHDKGEMDKTVEDIAVQLAYYGISVNLEKVRTFSGDYSANLKQLVFLPVGLRYKVDSVELLGELRQIGFERFIAENAKPPVDANSSIVAFKKNFDYDEAKWVLGNYKRLLENPPLAYERPTEANILELLQYYTIKPTILTGDELNNLVLIQEEFPSKQKWIMSLLLKEDERFRSMFKYHKSEYVRYLVTGRLGKEEFKEYKIGSQAVLVSNSGELAEVIRALRAAGYSQVKLALDFTNWTLHFSETCPKVLEVVYDHASKNFYVQRQNSDLPKVEENVLWPIQYAIGLWRLLCSHGVSLYTVEKTII